VENDPEPSLPALPLSLTTRREEASPALQSPASCLLFSLTCCKSIVISGQDSLALEQGLWSQNDWSSTPSSPRYWLHDLGPGSLASLSLGFLISETGKQLSLELCEGENHHAWHRGETRHLLRYLLEQTPWKGRRMGPHLFLALSNREAIRATLESDPSVGLVSSAVPGGQVGSLEVASRGEPIPAQLLPLLLTWV